ncbi:MAG: hypothetical protein HUK22_04455, partial [Thermoguttaceae bacterium]|nr:hypothetical protein [Thermoguttaceae bacterium]
IVCLGLKDMQPTFMRKIGVNGKSRTELTFEKVAVNEGRWDVEAKAAPGWTKDVREEEFSLLNPASSSALIAGAGAPSAPPVDAQISPDATVISVEDAAKRGVAKVAQQPAGAAKRQAATAQRPAGAIR